MKDGNFKCEASKLAFELFCLSGEISHYLLYKELENPELDKVVIEDREM